MVQRLERRVTIFILVMCLTAGLIFCHSAMAQAPFVWEDAAEIIAMVDVSLSNMDKHASYMWTNDRLILKNRGYTLKQWEEREAAFAMLAISLNNADSLKAKYESSPTYKNYLAYLGEAMFCAQAIRDVVRLSGGNLNDE
jgi:hypothetical protein